VYAKYVGINVRCARLTFVGMFVRCVGKSVGNVYWILECM